MKDINLVKLVILNMIELFMNISTVHKLMVTQNCRVLGFQEHYLLDDWLSILNVENMAWNII